MRLSQFIAALGMTSLPLLALAAQSTTLVAGVADARTGQPLKDAEIVLIELHRLAHTDWLGEVRIGDIPAGRHRVRVRKLGYAAADVELLFRGDSIGPVFMLEPASTLLDTVRVTAARVPAGLQPFESRRRMGIGRFLTDSQLVKEWDRPFALVAMTHFPGLELLRGADGREQLVSTRSSCGGQSSQHGPPPPQLGGGGIRSSFGDGGSAGGAVMIGSCKNAGCPVKLFLDDVDLGEEDFDIVRTWDLAGVEYYTGASMPARYRVPGSACGVLLLWSRW